MTSRIRKTASLLLVAFAGVCFWKGLPATFRAEAGRAVVAEAEAAVSTPQAASPATGPEVRLQTTPIQKLKVGDRVLAHNPEVTDAERASWQEPEWANWQRLQLELITADGGVLQIDMLRPQTWCMQHGVKPGAVIFLDLAEMGAVGDAVVLAVSSCPPIEPGTGQVITPTFKHPPSHQVHNVRFEGETDSIGVTDNHLFWSADREIFLPIGEMSPGERVQTFHGETKRLESKLPRPGPQFVYNLEVYGEHVYFVGEEGILAHNSCTVGSTDAYRRGFDDIDWGNGNRFGDFTEELTVSGDLARARLRSSLGLVRGNADEAHHLIPVGLRDHPIVQRAARSGFNFNGDVNGLPLSFDRHRGINIFHHNKYNTAIRRRLAFELSQRPNMTETEASDFLHSYTERLGNGIANSRARLR